MILLLTGGLFGRAGTPSVMSWPLQKLLPRRRILLLADFYTSWLSSAVVSWHIRLLGVHPYLQVARQLN